MSTSSFLLSRLGLAHDKKKKGLSVRTHVSSDEFGAVFYSPKPAPHSSPTSASMYTRIVSASKLRSTPPCSASMALPSMSSSEPFLVVIGVPLVGCWFRNNHLRGPGGFHQSPPRRLGCGATPLPGTLPSGAHSMGDDAPRVALPQRPLRGRGGIIGLVWGILTSHPNDHDWSPRSPREIKSKKALRTGPNSLPALRLSALLCVHEITR
jgi:hypothetical protein